jgi:ABC-type uncharacterized transport system substrate-binding protein
MRRREYLGLICGAVAAGPSWAQAPVKQYRMAIAAASAATLDDWQKFPLYRPILPELRRLGDVEGQNLIVEYFTAAGHVERYGELAQQIVRRKPDVILVEGDYLSALLKATHTLPIVFAIADPVAMGQLRSLGRHGGNLTGVSVIAGIEVEGKRLELLKEAFPAVSRVATLTTPLMRGPAYAQWGAEVRAYAAKLHLSLIEVALQDATPQEIERGFAELTQRRAHALLLDPEAAFNPHAGLIVRLAAERRLPTMYPYIFAVRQGGLMTYTFDPAELARQLADDVHRVLHGAKPADIPVYQPTRFRLTINLKAASAIGFTFPPQFLARADEVIE